MVIFMKKWIGKFQNKLLKKNVQWNEIEYFNPKWKKRIKDMSIFIEDGDSVLDLGCGEMWLREYLNESNKYFGVDYKERGENTIVCDFNKNEYPNIKADVAFISGCLEYIKDYEWFISKLSQSHSKIIISYCTLEEYSNIKDREAKAWVNHLKEEELLSLINSKGFELIHKETGYSTFFVFKK